MSSNPGDFLDSETRLTPAAREALEELVSTYRARLIAQAALDHRDGPISALELMRSVYSEPSPEDTQRVVVELAQIERENAQRSRRAFRSTVITSISLLVIGSFGALATFLPFNIMLDTLPLTAEAAVIGGMAVTVAAGLISLSLQRSRDSRRASERALRELSSYFTQELPSVRAGESDQATSVFEVNMRFLEQWQQVEEKLNLLAEQEIALAAGHRISFGTILRQLSQQRTLAPHEADLIRKMLTVRNGLVHGGLPKNYVLTDEVEQIMLVNDTLGSLLGAVPSSGRGRELR